MKKRKLTLLISIFAVLAMISVGFAAWVITNNAEAEDQGNVRVDVVDDKRLGITAEIKNDADVVFGAKEKNSAVQYNWLKYEDTNLNENLTIYVKLTVDNYSYLESSTAISITVSEVEGQTLYADALADNYVGALPTLNLSKAELINYAVKPYQERLNAKQSDLNQKTAEYDRVVADPTLGESSEEARNLSATIATLNSEITELNETIQEIKTEKASRLECEIPVVFTWGTAFGGKNPIDFYNASQYTNELGDSAFDALEALKALDEAKYVLKVQAFTK